MGGGTTTTAAYYGVKRKMELTQSAIKRTAKEYGVTLTREQLGDVKVVVLNEKGWAKKFPDYVLTAAGIYRESEDTLYIRRKYFAGRRTQGVITHETIHSYGGKANYGQKGTLPHTLEEGITEYLTWGTREHGYKGARGRKYAESKGTYVDQVSDVSILMGIVGRKKLITSWNKGFSSYTTTKSMSKHKRDSTKYYKAGDMKKSSDSHKKFARLREKNTEYNKIARELEKKGFTETAKAFRKYYEDESRTKMPESISMLRARDMAGGKATYHPPIYPVDKGER